MTTPKVAAIAAIAAIGAALAGCAPSERAVGNPAAPLTPNPTAAQAPATAEASAEHNAADLAFVQGMIPHHEQALAMSATAQGNGASEQVTVLAERIAQAQEPELGQLRSLLASWKAPAAGSATNGGTGHGAPGEPTAPAAPAIPEMPGMITPAQLQQLQQARGADFDRLFLQLMITHHEGAVQMAKAEVAGGMDPEAKALAQKIVEAQTAEIAAMRTLLGGS
jgi:uncharacterized protein (DUF305 family)